MGHVKPVFPPFYMVLMAPNNEQGGYKMFIVSAKPLHAVFTQHNLFHGPPASPSSGGMMSLAKMQNRKAIIFYSHLKRKVKKKKKK